MMKKKLLAGMFVATWVFGASYLMAHIHSWHVIDLAPKDKSDIQKLASIMNEVKGHGAIHFLTPTCGCSEVIFKSLLNRSPLAKSIASEMIVIIDDYKNDITTKLKQKKYNVINLTSEKLENEYKAAIKAVPLFVVYNKNKTIDYAGGYSDKSITPFTEIDISNFIKNIKANKIKSSLPVIGCSVSEKYKKILDPLGIKYKDLKDERYSKK